MYNANGAHYNDDVAQPTTSPDVPSESEQRVRKSVSLVADLRGPLVCLAPEQGIEAEPSERRIVECLENVSTKKNKTVRVQCWIHDLELPSARVC